jgi:BlaI family transcriptional regulator, penicillinase repressor
MPTPSDLELKILQVLWREGPGTVREILEAIADGKKRAYTTILTMLQIMERKGFVARTREGVSDRWRPVLRERNAMGGFWKNLLKRFCAGRPSVAVQHLLAAEKVDTDELEEIERVIRQYKERCK